MILNENSQATLLLTAYFSKPTQESAKPLTPTEWGKFARWLREKELAPENLLSPEPERLIEDWLDSRITKDRLLDLLRRGNAMALALEKWSRAGIWVIARSDATYPKRLKARLRDNAPPVLFGIGNANLLNCGGVAVVGSRNVPDQELSFAKGLGQKAAVAGVSVVSGGARGVDEAAMLGATEAEGTAVGILADSLLKAATASKWRSALREQNLVLVSPFYPEAGFNAGNAMARNKYIYCLADAAVVAHSGIKGGTWNGAVEALKNDWVPVWVKPTDDKSAGNSMIVENGGRWCEEHLKDIEFHKLYQSEQRGEHAKSNASDETQASIFDLPDSSAEFKHESAGPTEKCKDGNEQLTPEKIEKTEAPETPAELDEQKIRASEPSVADNKNKADQEQNNSDKAEKAMPLGGGNGTSEHTPDNAYNPVDFFRLFIQEMKRLASEEPITVDEVSEQLGLHKRQVDDWIKRSLEEGHLEKLHRPVRYRCKGPSGASDQLDMLLE
ncbi:DNA-processing protein DprA [Microbulbifer agarilyticus]